MIQWLLQQISTESLVTKMDLDATLSVTLKDEVHTLGIGTMKIGSTFKVA